MTPGANALRVAAKIVEGQKLRLASHKQKRTPSQSNRASSLGNPCARALYYLRTDAVRELPETSDDLQAVFDEGKLHEQDMLRQLTEMGLDVFGTQDSFPPNSYQVTGHVDVKLAVASSGSGVLVIEGKAINGTHYDQIQTDADGIGDWRSVKEHSSQFVRGYYTQAEVYGFLADTDELMLLFKSKATGRFKPVPLPLDLEHVQECLERAEQVNRAIPDQWKSATLHELPPFVKDRSVCLRCPFAARACKPPGMDHRGEGLMVYADEQAEEAATTMLLDAHAATRHANAKSYLRDVLSFLAQGKDRILVIGNTYVSVKYRGGKMFMDVLPLGSQPLPEGDGGTP